MTASEALIAALVEIERHVASSGWDQPARLFALVPTAELIAAEPSLAGQLRDGADGSLSSVEQDTVELRSGAGGDLLSALDRISWPNTVYGCAVAVERTFLPAALEAELPADPDAAAALVAAHPDRHELRVVVGVIRGGGTHGVGRVRGTEELVGGPDLVPALAAALTRTLE